MEYRGIGEPRYRRSACTYKLLVPCSYCLRFRIGIEIENKCIEFFESDQLIRNIVFWESKFVIVDI